MFLQNQIQVNVHEERKKAKEEADVLQGSYLEREEGGEGVCTWSERRGEGVCVCTWSERRGEGVYVLLYRRHRFISTCAYRSNSGDMGAKKRAGAYKRGYRGHAPLWVTPMHAREARTVAREANLRVKENGLELG